VFDELGITELDCIISDMAPDTMWRSDIDALRSVGLIEKTLWIYEEFLKEWWTFAIKIFMWPGFEELVRELKDIYGHSSIVTYKPKSCRKQSKETFIIKRS
jgi:23S rRNA U2552 (ribose-2'-O)-methylase RlmE/FtsJ